MKKLLTLLCGLWISSANAQTYVPFPDSNAMWSYVTCYNINPSPPPLIINCNTYYYLFGGDSIFNGITYHSVYRYNDSTLTTNMYHGLIRLDTLQKKVFYIIYATSVEKMLYNFNANIGDTMCEITASIVTSIDSILTNTGYRKRFHTNFDDVLDGIGSFFDLIYEVYLEATYNISCFTQNGSLVYMNPNFSSCNLEIGIKEKNKSVSEISISPNPVTNCSHLIGDFSLSDNVVIEIYDYTGRKIVKSLKSTSMDFTLCNKDLNSGYYILKVTCNNRIYDLTFIMN